MAQRPVTFSRVVVEEHNVIVQEGSKEALTGNAQEKAADPAAGKAQASDDAVPAAKVDAHSATTADAARDNGTARMNASRENATAAPVHDIHDDTGLMACLSKKTLLDLGVSVNAFPALAAVADDACVSPGRYVPQAYTAFDFQKMRLDISIPQAALQSRPRGWIPPEQWDEGLVYTLNPDTENNASLDFTAQLVQVGDSSELAAGTVNGAVTLNLEYQ